MYAPCVRLFSALAWLGLVLASAACGTTNEEQPPAHDAGIEDASATDASTTEDVGVPDAGSDGPPLTGFCNTQSPKPAFCDDFDDDDVDDDWTILTQSNGIGALNETSATSTPASFTVQTAELVKDQTANVHLRASMKGKPTRIRFAFNAQFSEVSFTDGAIAYATLDVSSTHYFTLYLRDQDPDAPATTLEEINGATTNRYVLPKTPLKATWTRIVLDVDLAAGSATVSYNNEKVFETSAIVKTPSDEPTIRLGAVYTFGPFPEWEGRFDDVVVSFP